MRFFKRKVDKEAEEEEDQPVVVVVRESDRKLAEAIEKLQKTLLKANEVFGS